MYHTPKECPTLDPEMDIDDANEVYAAEFNCDDLGNEFEVCPNSDNGRLFKTECGVTICVHCERMA